MPMTLTTQDPETDRSLFGDRPPLRLRDAVRAVLGSVVRSVAPLARGRIRQPRTHVGDVLHFADGTSARVYRETVVRRRPAPAPAALAVTFRLRAIRGRGHTMFRVESLLNTPLFAGFPGLVSKLWLAHDERGRYRGLYEWDDPSLADAYARSLWWVLSLVCPRDSIHYTVLPGRHRDALTDPDPTASADRDWWRPGRVDPD
jgi:hypothetical protein